MNCGIVYDPFFEKHKTGTSHPEKFNRATYIYKHLKKKGYTNESYRININKISEENLALVHCPNYLKKAKKEILSGQSQLSTGDTNICPKSWDVASYASGGILNAVEHVINGKFNQAFCLTRPPGHHANSEKGMGFCLFNHIALAARYAQKNLGSERFLLSTGMFITEMELRIFFMRMTRSFFSAHTNPLGTQELAKLMRRVKVKDLVTLKHSSPTGFRKERNRRPRILQNTTKAMLQNLNQN